MKRLTTFACLTLIVFAAAAMASPANRGLQGYEVADGRYDFALTNEDQVGFAKSGVDTFCMISHVLSPPGDDAEVNFTIGPNVPVWSAAYSCPPWPIFLGPTPGNTYNGDFQTDIFLPNWDDWYCVDYTQKTTPIWHCSAYFAVSGLSWFCGDETIPSCGGGDPVGGYGNNYDEWLSYYTNTVTNPGITTNVSITYDVNFDNEPGYDYLYLRQNTAGGWVVINTHNGGPSSLTGVVGAMSFAPADLVGGQCYFQFQGTSDGAWSDADCSWPTQGMAQVDNMVVSGDNGVTGGTEDCDTNNDPRWVIEFPPGVGSFCYVWPLMKEIDDCCVDETPQVGFVDDGNVVPGLGTQGITWTYFDGGWIVNTEGGLAGPDFHLQNEVWSPIVHWPDADVGVAAQYDGAFIEFSVYRHFGLGPVWGGMFYVWHVRSTTSTDPCAILTETWADRNFVYYGGPDCIRNRSVVSDLLHPGRKYVQMALGIYELGWAWGWNGQDASAAPYFDDARFCAFVFGGPAFSTREIELAQDNFPENGALNCADPCGMNVRFDAAWDVSLQAENFCYYGDSVTFDIVAVRTGTVLPQEDQPGYPELCYKLDPNPLFNGCRDSGLPNKGCVFGDSARTNGQGNWVTDTFEFDLPDGGVGQGFFFPGDMIHYYIRATDSGGGTTTIPGDTSGFASFPGDPTYIMLDYPSSYTVRALPSIQNLTTCEHPHKLWWNDFANRGLEAEWMNAWHQNGYAERENYDIFYTNGPSSGVGNGLGGKATVTQLLGYDMLAYSSGDLDQFTISDQNFTDDCGDDPETLTGWFETPPAKCMFLTGNDLVDDLNNRGGAALTFENDYIGVQFNDTRHDVLLGQWNPAVQATPLVGNPVFACATRWMVDAYCNPILRYIDIVTPNSTTAGNAQFQVAEFLSAPNDAPPCALAYPTYAAAVYNTWASGNEVLYLPYDLGWIREDTQCGGNTGTCTPGAPVRAEVLRDAIHMCGNPTGSTVIGVPELEKWSFKSYPVPFNPQTKVEYNMPKRGMLHIAVYNVRGELVKVLVNEEVAGGPGFVTWDGTDATGAAVSSGVYFFKTTHSNKTNTYKTMLVK